jgi:hypothetical protein
VGDSLKQALVDGHNERRPGCDCPRCRPMLALTLHQPWAFAVAHLGKDVENRGWPPPAKVIDQRIAIHAGLHVDREAMDHLRRIGIALPDSLVAGAVVATVRVAGVREWRKAWPTQPPLSRWFTGPFGWQLEDVLALAKPVPCKGRQGLWRLPDDVEARVLEQEVRRG